MGTQLGVQTEWESRGLTCPQPPQRGARPRGCSCWQRALGREGDGPQHGCGSVQGTSDTQSQEVRRNALRAGSQAVFTEEAASRLRPAVRSLTLALTTTNLHLPAPALPLGPGTGRVH